MIARMTLSVHHYRRIAVALVLLLMSCMVFAGPLTQRIYSVNYSKLDVSTVLKSISDMTGANILVKPGVTGDVSLRLTNKSLDEILDAIAMLTGSDYTLDNGIYVFSKFQQIATPVATEKMTVEFVQLQHAPVEDIIAVLGVAYPMLEVKAFPSTKNRLIVRGSEENLRLARQVIDELDALPVPVGAEMKEVSYTLRMLVPWQAKEYLDTMFGAQGLTVTFIPNQRWKNEQPMPEISKNGENAPTAVDPTELKPELKWESDQLILRGPGAVVDLALANLEKIDSEVRTSSVRVSVQRIMPTQAMTYLLQEYEAKGLTIVTAPMTISNDFGASEKNQQLGMKVVRDKDGRLNVAEPVGDFFLMGPEDVVTLAQATLETIDIGSARVLRIVNVRFLHVREAKKKLDEIFQNRGMQVFIAPAQKGETPAMAADTGEGSAAAVISDEAALLRVSDLLLAGPEDVVEQAVQLLAQLDRESDQISITSQVVSISKGDVTTLGVEWPASVGVNLTEVASSGVLRIGRIVRDPIGLNATLHFLETKNRARILSQPSTVVQNGREATIHVGEKIMYETAASYSTDGRPNYTVQTIDTGVTLIVLPQMSRDGIITLAITCVVSELAGFTKGASGADLPQLKETKTRTTVQVRDNETLVIGGLTQHQFIVTEKGVPILSRIPLIGAAFKSKTTRPSSADLLIMVTPKSLSSSAEGNGVGENPFPQLPAPLLNDK